ncbi:hypothetical protein [Litoreibacter arenae]|uniref:CBS domain-containing protein n=1 Tax=Litoreibacter arenae DSM 19593 TaxID=1123360 RepID=S9QN83_9RHOB|nr:hypothetical protein [Litoreibacter arenae]EPX81147.1 hypothetical protein thalar_00596 [Litoreibacter arenae DSM 19593]
MSAGVVEFSEQRHLNDLKSVQGQLTLSNIMTPRHEFICCTANEPAQGVMERIPAVFDAVPVIDSTDATDTSAPIIGLLHRDHIPFRNKSIRAADCADASAITQAHPSNRNLLVYIHDLSGHPVEFVQEDGQIVGLVTPYDLERLPVRTALFAQIINVERLIGDLIRERFPDTVEWERLISPNLRSELQTGLARARGAESSGHAILSVGFGVKLDLLAHCFEGARNKSWALQERHEIRIFRNNVAHGAPFPDVMQLPGQVRNLIRLRILISGRIAKLKGQDS